MKKAPLLLLLSILLLCNSCGGDAVPVPITFVFDKALPQGKYPDYFKDITEPFSATQCDTDYLLKPINVARIDIKKAPVELNAWYFEQMGDNTVEFSKNWLSQFYKDSLMIDHLSKPTKKVVSDNALDSYLSKKEVLTLIFSEESYQEQYNDTPIYTSAKEVTSKIREELCSNSYTEIVVLVNPSQLASEPQQVIEETDSDTTIEVVETYANPCDQPTTNKALDLNDAIAGIINTNATLTERLNKAENVWTTYCHPNAYVALYKQKNTESFDVWNPGSGKNYFTNRLAILESIVSTAIFRVEFANDGKISGIHIIECQNANELM